CPSKRARHGAGERAHKGADGVHALQRRIGGEGEERREQRKPCGQWVTFDTQVQRTAQSKSVADYGSVRQAHAPRGKWPMSRAPHMTINVIFLNLVESRGCVV